MRVLIVALGGNDGAARPAGRRSCGAIWRRSSSARRRAASRSCSPGWKRRRTRARLHRRLPRRVSRRWRSAVSASPLVPFLLRGRRRHRRAESARRHPSDGRGRPHRRRQRVDGARSRLLRHSGEPAQEGAPDHDRAARGLQDRHERHRAADHSSPADAPRFRAASSSRSSGRRAAASRRCSG